MAKIKKTKKTKIEEIAQDVAFEPINETTANLQPSLDIVQKRYADCEWCFQFDEDVPQIFAWTDPELNRDENPKIIFEITNVENSYISFTSTETGKTFKIFVRELTKDGEAMREKQKEFFKLSQKDLENFDEKMEKYASENKEA